jgi:hypothetical protein
MQMIMGSNKRWSDLTARQKAPLVVQEIVQMTLLVAALTDIHRRPTEEINGSEWVWSVVRRPSRSPRLQSCSSLRRAR